MFDPSVGRFLSEDPIEFDAGDSNLYRYVGNSPTNRTDPSGLQKAEGLGFSNVGVEPIDKGDDPFADPNKKWYTEDVIKYTLGDGKVGYHFPFNFVVANKYRSERRHVLQAQGNGAAEPTGPE
jgi:uncharacterized protein RhaS with RHS repeats